MFHENEAPKNYRVSTSVGVTQACTPDPGSIAGGGDRVGWGDPLTFVTVDISFIHNPGAIPADTWTAIINYPISWDGIGTLTVNGTGAPAAIESRTEWDAAQLVKNSDCSAVFSFSAFRWKLNDGGGFALELTIGAQSMGFGGYDKRFNDYRNGCAGGPVGTPIPSASPSCGSGYASLTAHDYAVAGSAEGGWEWWDGAIWQSDAVAIDQTLVPPVIACTCSRALPTISAADSAHLATSFAYIDVLTKTLGAISFGTCMGTAYSQQDWSANQAGHYTFENLRAVPSWFGIPVLRQHSDAYCDTVVPFGSETNYDPADSSSGTTYIAYSKTVLNWAGKANCADGNPCFAGEIHTFCGYTGHAIESWPTAPSCGKDHFPSYDVSFSGRHYVGWIRE